jgi:hypothetical protein
VEYVTLKFPTLSAIKPRKKGAKTAATEETLLIMPVSSTVIPNDFMWMVMKENSDPMPIRWTKKRVA